MTVGLGFSVHVDGGVTDTDFDGGGATLVFVSFLFDTIPDGTSFPDSDPDHILRAGWWASYAIDPGGSHEKLLSEPTFINFKGSIWRPYGADGLLCSGVRVQIGPNGGGLLTAYTLTP